MVHRVGEKKSAHIKIYKKKTKISQCKNNVFTKRVLHFENHFRHFIRDRKEQIDVTLIVILRSVDFCELQSVIDKISFHFLISVRNLCSNDARPQCPKLSEQYIKQCSRRRRRWKWVHPTQLRLSTFYDSSPTLWWRLGSRSLMQTCQMWIAEE